MNKKLHNKYPVWFLFPVMFFYTVFFILPNITTFIFAFTDWSIYYLFDIKFIGLDNFKFMANERVLIGGIINTFYFAIITVLFKNLIGFVLALVLDRDLRTKSYLRGVFFLPAIISPMIAAVIFSAIYNPDYGIINILLRDLGLGSLAREWIADPKTAMNSVCLMEIWQGAGFHMFIYIAGLQSIEKQYYEAAIIDGAGYLQRVRHITVPLIMPTITINATISLISGLKVFGQVYALTNGGPGDSTQVISTLVFKAFSNGALGYGSAINLLFTLGISVITLTMAVILRRKEIEIA